MVLGTIFSSFLLRTLVTTIIYFYDVVLSHVCTQRYVVTWLPRLRNETESLLLNSMCASFQSIYSGTCCAHYVYCEDSLGSQVWCSSFSFWYSEYFLGTLLSLFVSKNFHLVWPRLQLQQTVMVHLFTPSATQAIPKSKQ
jgi:hypothetical protein